MCSNHGRRQKQMRPQGCFYHRGQDSLFSGLPEFFQAAELKLCSYHFYSWWNDSDGVMADTSETPCMRQSYVSRRNRTKAVLADEAHRCQVSRAEWAETASRLPDETPEESVDAGSALRLLSRIDAYANCTD